jgi:Tfp pilus assembly protein PilN
MPTLKMNHHGRLLQQQLLLLTMVMPVLLLLLLLLPLLRLLRWHTDWQEDTTAAAGLLPLNPQSSCLHHHL